MQTVYRAIDGREFSTGKDCHAHEDTVLDRMVNNTLFTLVDGRALRGDELLDILEQSCSGKDEQYGTKAEIFMNIMHSVMLLAKVTPTPIAHNDNEGITRTG